MNKCLNCGKDCKNKFCSRGCSNTYNKTGKKLSEETKRKISESHKGLHVGDKNVMYGKKGKDNPNYGSKRSEETREKMRQSAKGFSDEAREKINEKIRDGRRCGKGNSMYGKHHSEDSKNKISSSLNEFHKNYHKEDINYGKEGSYRYEALKSQGEQCVVCGESEKPLQVHHIDGNHFNDEPSNLVVLCLSCHLKAHHVNGKRSTKVNEEFKLKILESKGGFSNGNEAE